MSGFTGCMVNVVSTRAAARSPLLQHRAYIHSAAEELENSLMTNQQSQWQYAQLNLCEAIKYTLTQQSEH